MPTVYDGPQPYDSPFPYENPVSAQVAIQGTAVLAPKDHGIHDAVVDI
jgi:hypothetical protein